MKKAVLGILILAAIYLGSYFLVRQTNSDVWERDNHTYVLFPNPFAYYLYRPVTYLDGELTGMRFHIGPHR